MSYNLLNIIIKDLDIDVAELYPILHRNREIIERIFNFYKSIGLAVKYDKNSAKFQTEGDIIPIDENEFWF